ncbi:MAG: Rrf2 family transcriptional regulator [Dethiobacter sp.]|jgi:Rrf2 family nitric oxide-sensitive transcriptional repressor|nr:Rrf2 family transcriptional regulator [Dethiobacter sp.]
MKLARRSDYSLRTLIYLAENKGRITNHELAQVLGISSNHLYKIVQTLSRAGYLRTSAGREGGVELGKSAHEITLLEIIRLVEGPINLSDCFLNADECFLVSKCKLRKKIKEAQNILIGMFSETTIEDLLDDEKCTDKRETAVT